MFCTECGSKIPDDSRFCPDCGQAIEESEVAMAQPAPPKTPAPQPSGAATVAQAPPPPPPAPPPLPPAVKLEPAATAKATDDTIRLPSIDDTARLAPLPSGEKAADGPPVFRPPADKQVKPADKPKEQDNSPSKPLTKAPPPETAKRGIPKLAVAAALVLLIGAGAVAYKFTAGPPPAKPAAPASQPAAPAAVAPPAKPQPPEIIGQLADMLRRTRAVGERYYSAKVAGNAPRTIANYRAMERAAYDLKARMPAHPADGEAAAVIKALQESLAGLEEAAEIMADYLEGKRSMAPPNPDWVMVADESFDDAWKKMEQAEAALRGLRAKYQ